MSDRLSPGGLALAVLTAILSGVGITLLKGGLGDAQAELSLLPLLAGVVVYGVGLLTGVILLGRYPLSLAYPVVMGLSLVLVAALSALTLGETPTTPRLAGAGLIIVGVWFLCRPGRKTA